MSRDGVGNPSSGGDADSQRTVTRVRSGASGRRRHVLPRDVYTLTNVGATRWDGAPCRFQTASPGEIKGLPLCYTQNELA